MKAFCVASAALLACATGLVSAQDDGNGTTNQDAAILQYALTLEHLEHAFYRDGLALLEEAGGEGNDTGNGTTGLDEELIKKLTEIRDHEAAHVRAIQAAIIVQGELPVQECQYDFSWSSPIDFLQIARILENVGTSAYVGSAYELTDKRYLTAAASIATVEARHAAYLNHVNDVSPFPTAFDSPLDRQSVIGLVSGYIRNCPNGQGLPLEPRPHLEADPLLVHLGKTVNVTADVISDGNVTADGLYCIFYAASASSSTNLEVDAASTNGTASYYCRIPDNAHLGDTFLFLSRSSTYELDNPEPIVAGPAIVYVHHNATVES
jgi:hypothetical protein